MSFDLSTWAKDKFYNALIGTAAFTLSTCYVALHTSAPNDTTAAGEIAGNGYARAAITFAAPTNGVTSNSPRVPLARPTGAWGTIAYITLHDHKTQGHYLGWEALSVPRPIVSNDIVRFSDGALTLDCGKLNVSNEFANKMVNVFRGTALTNNNLYMELYSVPPSDAGGGTPISGGAYARAQLTMSSVLASGGVGSNSVVVAFPTPSTDWNATVAAGMFTHKTKGTFAMWKAVATTYTIYQDDEVSFPVGSLITRFQ